MSEIEIIAMSIIDMREVRDEIISHAEKSMGYFIPFDIGTVIFHTNLTLRKGRKFVIEFARE